MTVMMAVQRIILVQEHPWMLKVKVTSPSQLLTKVSDDNTHRHPESKEELPKSTPTKKVSDGNAEEEIGDLGKPSKTHRLDDAMECW